MPPTYDGFRRPRRCGIGLRVAWLFAGAALQTTPVLAQSRGELLYTTHCIACHSDQVHWRDGRLATDWRSLGAQVRRWQAAGALNWSDEDIDEVTRYLNKRYYGFTPNKEGIEAHEDLGRRPPMAGAPR